MHRVVAAIQRQFVFVSKQIYAGFFGDHKPARAVVPVPVLHYGFKLELEAVAGV